MVSSASHKKNICVPEDASADAAGGAVDAAGAEEEQPLFSKIDLRVGKIVRVWNHEKAERLYCEEIDVGEGAPRQIASGLREHYSLEDMQDRLVIVVCNLKSSKLVGFESQGMVLAAKADGKVELVSPPAGSRAGERIFLAGGGECSSAETTPAPVSANAVKKGKVWEAFAEKLKSDDACVASFDGRALVTSAGECVVVSVQNGPIS